MSVIDKAARATFNTDVDPICVGTNCRGHADPESPVPLCGTHIRAVYEYAHDLVGDRWRDALNVAAEMRAPAPPPGINRAEGGHVYFVRIGPLIKIGWSSYPKARFRTLKVKPEDVLALVPGTRRDEERCHAAFAHLLQRGREYFRPGEDLLAFIADLSKAA